MLEPVSQPRTLARRLVAGALTLCLIGGLATSGGCGGSVQTYPIAIAVGEASGYFSPLRTCAEEAKLSARDSMHGVYVTLDAGTELQFLVQGSSFNLVVWVNASVQEQDRPKAQQAGKAKADELVACAKALGPTAPPPASTATPTGDPTEPPAETSTTATATAPPTTTATAKPTSTATEVAHMQIKALAPEACATSKKKCESQSDCTLDERCAGGLCYVPKNGCPCDNVMGCADVTNSHCGKGICYPNAVGAPCDDDDNAMECGLASGLHCAKGLCYPNKTGAPCKADWECTVGTTATGSSACVQGVCN